VDYDLRNRASDGQSWAVIERLFSTPRDISESTHVRLAMRGVNLNSHEIVEVKLKNGSNGIFTASLNSMTDLAVWRPIYIDFREFTGSSPIDLSNITGLEIGIKRCDDCEVFDVPAVGQPSEHVGTLMLDEFAVVDLKPGAVNRIVQRGFEIVSPNPVVLGLAANAILARVATTGPGQAMVPAWFPETSPNFNMYAQAQALLVFTHEFERTGNTAFRTAARSLADKLISLQIPQGRVHFGAWHTAYSIESSTLRPPNRYFPRTAPARCDGNEGMPLDPVSGVPVANDIDSCEWVGNVGWVMVALARLQRSGFYENSSALQTALDRAAAWLIGQPRYRGNIATAPYPNVISFGIEGNISAYFGLLAAKKNAEAEVLGNAIYQFAWDPIQRRMKPGVRSGDVATALDVSGSWGVNFLRAIGRTQEALDSQGYSASVMRTSSFTGSIQGYGDIAGPYTPPVEFSAQAAAAGIKDAAFVMRQLMALQIPSNATDAGAFRGAADHFYGGSLNPWTTTMPGVSPTAWVYFAMYQDPLQELAPVTDIPFTTAQRGGFTATSQGSPLAITSGYARLQPAAGSTNISGLAVFGLRVGGILVSEAGVPASSPLTSGRIYTEVQGPVNTGVAIANGNAQTVTINYFFTNLDGTNFGSGSTTIGANSQISGFLNQPPFNSGSGVNGTFTFTASAPVAVVALRGLTNERGEFLMTTLPVTDLSVAGTSQELFFPHFAEGGGWTTQIVLVNNSDQALNGSVQFRSSSGQNLDRLTYSIPSRSSRVLRTSSVDSTTQSGSVRLTPAAGNNSPVGLLVFSFRKDGIVVSEAGVPALRTGNGLRLFVESFGQFQSAETGSGQTGIAITNPSPNPAVVNLEFNPLSGSQTGLTQATITIPGNGQIASFIYQISGLNVLGSSFQGILRVSTLSGSGISLTGLRGRYNERLDFLITTAPPSFEAAVPSSAELFFPHIVDGGGYTTQFNVFAGNDQPQTGTLRFFRQLGQSFSLALSKRGQR